jgi:hypothetical protein
VPKRSPERRAGQLAPGPSAFDSSCRGENRIASPERDRLALSIDQLGGELRDRVLPRARVVRHCLLNRIDQASRQIRTDLG